MALKITFMFKPQSEIDELEKENEKLVADIQDMLKEFST